MKRTGFKPKTMAEIKEREKRKRAKEAEKKKLKAEKVKARKLARKLKKSLPKQLYKISHDFVRLRDSVGGGIRGFCCSCGKFVEGPKFQAGHYRTSGGNGILLRYHPRNMHGQCQDCNMWKGSEDVKVEYARFMHRKYSNEQLENMRLLKFVKDAKADRQFYETMIELYKVGDEEEIVKFLEAYLKLPNELYGL